MWYGGTRIASYYGDPIFPYEAGVSNLLHLTKPSEVKGRTIMLSAMYVNICIPPRETNASISICLSTAPMPFKNFRISDQIPQITSCKKPLREPSICVFSLEYLYVEILY